MAQEEKLQISVVDMDVNSDDSVSKAIDFIVRADGTIDYLINNAGYMFVGITEAYSIQQAKDQFETNFFGILRTTKAVAPYMRKQEDGLIINVTSWLGGYPSPILVFTVPANMPLRPIPRHFGMNWPHLE